MAELFEIIDALSNDLTKSIKVLWQHGNELAEAERAYRIKATQEALRLKIEGMPVTLITEVLKGLECVADARFKRDVAQSMYDANRESINSLKLQIRVAQEQWSREYANERGIGG